MLTPTDVAGWIAVIPWLLLALAIVGAAAWLLEETERGRELTERVLDRVLR